MTLEFGNGTYYSRLWFLDCDGFDWLAALFLPPGESEWKFVYRMRYDETPEKPEHRNWYTVRLAGEKTAQDCLKKLNQIIPLIVEGAQAIMGTGRKELHTLVLETADGVALFAALQRETWCNFSLVKEATG